MYSLPVCNIPTTSQSLVCVKRLSADIFYPSFSDEYDKKKHPNDVAKNEGLTSAGVAVSRLSASWCVSLAVSIAGLALLRPVPG